MAQRDNTPRDLLFGLLALQTGFINQAALVAAFHAWALAKDRPMSEVLLEQGAIDGPRKALIEGLVGEHVKMHGGDPERSLATLSAGVSTRERLARLGDTDLNRSLDCVGPGRADDDHHTRTVSIPPSPSAAVGQRFRVVRNHAKGGLGEVFVAIDTELNREVALKEIQLDHAFDPVSRGRFLLEAEITGGLEHPGIVPVYGLGSYDDGRPYYAMRFIRGDSLKEAVAAFHADEGLAREPGRRSLELRKLLRRFLDVCNAIDYAHNRGVLHRDLKPGNVMVGRYGETLVVDWGLAKAVGRAEPDGGSENEERTLVPSSSSGSAETLPGSALGTPSYMSPEQARGDLEALGPHSDVYSLGATLYFLLTGKAPFVGNDVGAILRAVQRGDFPPPRAWAPRIDRALEAVCLKAMALAPKDRYASARALAEDVERWIADEPVKARREPVAARAWRWARRHRTAVAALGLSLATAVVLLTVLNVLVGAAQRQTARALARVTEEQARTAEALGRADANFRRARQAVEDYFTTVSQEVILDEPGMQPLRHKLLRSALEYHELFLKERGGDPAVEAELADSHRRLANLARSLDRRVDPLPHARTALEMFRELARRHPDRPEYRFKLAGTLVDLGVVLVEEKTRGDEAESALREAVGLYDALLLERPGNATVQAELADALTKLGLRRTTQRGGNREAAEFLGRARDVIQGLVAREPESIRYRTRLADLHYTMYSSYIGSQRRQAEALRSSEEAVALYKGLLERVPNSPRFLYGLATMYDARGAYYARAGRFEAAIREIREACAHFGDLVRLNPEVDRYRAHRSFAVMRLGLWLARTGSREEALAPLREAIGGFERFLADHPNDMSIQEPYLGALSALGSTLGGLGRVEESISVLKRAGERGGDICRRDPTNIFLRGNFMAGRLNLGLSLTLAGRHEEAVAVYEDFLAICRDYFGGDWSHGGVDQTKPRIDMAYSFREVGRDKEAEEIVAEARPTVGDRPGYLFHLARYEARGAALLSRRGGPSGAVEAARGRAMDALRRVVRLGGVIDPGLSGVGAADLDALRDRPDFQALAAELTFPADPFAPAR